MNSRSPFKAWMSGPLGAALLSCPRAGRLQSEATCHQVVWIARLRLAAHLGLCGWCRRYGRQLQFLRTAAMIEANRPPSETASGLPEASRHRITMALREALGKSWQRPCKESGEATTQGGDI
jgi:hypothetical protein